MANSTLQVQVSSAVDAATLSDATVSIRDALGNIVHTLYTDGNGMTPIAPLFAPNRKYSLNPYSTHPAYSIYEVRVNNFGYVPQIVRGVQVYEGENSFLPVDLEPRDEHSDHTVNIIEIPPPSASRR